MSMAQLVKFIAMRGLYKPKTEEEKAEIIEKEKAAAEQRAEMRAERERYLKFWTEKYADISDESAVINFEYALENVDNQWIHFLYGRTWAKNIRAKLKYPDLHCDALIKTHREVLVKHARYLQHEAFYGKGRYVQPDITQEEMKRIYAIGRVCNWWLNGEGWRGC